MRKCEGHQGHQGRQGRQGPGPSGVKAGGAGTGAGTPGRQQERGIRPPPAN